MHILYHIFDFVQQKKTKFTMEQPYMLPIVYWQYHACWCSGDFRSQGISRHGINPQSQNIPSPASEEVKLSKTYPNINVSKLRCFHVGKCSWIYHLLDSDHDGQEKIS